MIVQASRPYTDSSQDATIIEMPQNVATVVVMKALSGADSRLRYCDETETLYQYETTGSAFTADDLYVLTTADGGNTRWLGVAGRYIAGTGSAGILLNPSAAELTWGSELLTNPNLDDATGWTYTNGAAWNAAGEAWLYNGVIATVTVVNGGTGYSVNDVLTIADGTGGTVTVATEAGGVVQTVTVTTSGYGYSVATHATTGAGNNDCTIGVATLKTPTVAQNYTFTVGDYYKLTLTFNAGSTGSITPSAGGWTDANSRSATCTLYFKAVTASSSVSLPFVASATISQIVKITSISLVKKTASPQPIIQVKGSDGTVIFSRLAGSGAGRVGTIIQGGNGAGENLSNSPGAIIIGYAAAPMLQDSYTPDSVVIIGSGAAGNVQNAYGMTIVGGGAATSTALTAAAMIGATCFGYQAGASATTLAGATCVGSYAGQTSTTLSNAVVIGYSAAARGTHLSSVCIGYFAGASTGTVMTGGVAIGHQAGYKNSGGTGVFLGYMAGSQTNVGGGAGCVFIGYQAGKECTTANTLIIENSSDITTPLIYGDFAGNAVVINGTFKATGNVGFNNVSPAAQSTGWTTSNVTTDKVLDANSTTLDEVADVLCTLIEALKGTGIIGA